MKIPLQKTLSKIRSTQIRLRSLYVCHFQTKQSGLIEFSKIEFIQV